jgi:hypothetical protein
VGQTLDRCKKNPETTASSFQQQEVLIYGDSVLGHHDDEHHVTFLVFSVDHSHHLDHSILRVWQEEVRQSKHPTHNRKPVEKNSLKSCPWPKVLNGKWNTDMKQKHVCWDLCKWI